ncbi:MAG: isoprenylcysteine carboxylmethyltransferase family protein [Candidatus Dormiibacterota bacterium]
MDLRWLAVAAIWSLEGVGVVWLLTAVWFAARRPATLRGKAWHFLRTLLPEPWMLLGLGVLLVLLQFVPSAFLQHLTYDQAALRAAGAALTIVSALLMVWARLALGDMWAGRPMVQERHELRTGGPYRLARHPIYSGMIGAVLGLTLLGGFGGMLFVLAFVVGWLAWRVRVEDRMMIATFGDRYRAYQAQVRALLPLPRRLAHS